MDERQEKIAQLQYYASTMHSAAVVMAVLSTTELPFDDIVGGLIDKTDKLREKVDKLEEQLGWNLEGGLSDEKRKV